MKIRFSHLSVSERRKIERWRQAKVSPDEMARRLGRHRSTIFRELRRNRFIDTELPDLNGYWGLIAQGKADGRRSRRRKLLREAKLRERVEHCLSCGWTPEQIAGRMRYEGAPERVRPKRRSTATSTPTKAAALNFGATCPPAAVAAAAIASASARPRNSPRNSASCSVPTSSRTARSSATGIEAGPWRQWRRVSPPRDRVLFRQKFGAANVTTLIERMSRFLVVLKNPEKRTKPIMAQIAKTLGPLPAKARRSVTFDRGSEFVDWPHLQARTGAKAWFCDSQSPWQKGAIEHANKRLRRWIPAIPTPGASLKPTSGTSAPP